MVSAMSETKLLDRTRQLLEEPLLGEHDLDTRVRLLLEGEYLRRLGRYRRLDRTLTQKYGMTFEEFMARRVVQQKGYTLDRNSTWLEKMVATLQPRAKTLIELVELAHFYLKDEIQIEEKAAKKFLTPESREPLTELIKRLSALKDFSQPAIEETFSEILKKRGLALGRLAQPARVALTGSTVSPGIYEVIAVLGKERTLKRLRDGLDYIKTTGKAQTP